MIRGSVKRLPSVAGWLVVVPFLCFSLHGQLIRPSVQANGTATVSAPPDQAIIDATASTTGTSAQDAAGKNASQAAGLLAALMKLVGSSGTVKTTYYSVYPVYVYPQNAITGYTAQSTVEVTLSDLTLAGAVIDTAVANGATSLSGISFSLKDSEPEHRQALQSATQQAMAHATAMAIGAGHTVGSIRSVQEGSIVPVYAVVAGSAGGGGGGVATPVQPGPIQVTVTVTLVADLN